MLLLLLLPVFAVAFALDGRSSGLKVFVDGGAADVVSNVESMMNKNCINVKHSSQSNGKLFH